MDNDCERYRKKKTDIDKYDNGKASMRSNAAGEKWAFRWDSALGSNELGIVRALITCAKGNECSKKAKEWMFYA